MKDRLHRGSRTLHQSRTKAMMTTKQFNSIVEELELGQAELGHLLDLDERQVRRYRAGTAVPQPIAILLWLLHRGRIKISDLQKPRRPSPLR